MSTADKVIQALQPFDLKSEPGGGYRSNSPLRPGANSHSFTLTIHDSEHGAWFDHRDGVGGTLYDLAAKLGIELPERQKVENSKRSYASLEDYAALKGVPVQAFIDAGWNSEITQSENRPCIEFKTQGGLRRRFLDGVIPSFKSASGFKPCWYGLDKAIKAAEKNTQKLILCNGEPSTIVAQFHGLAAFCMPGGENHNVTKVLIDELQKKWSGEILIALDCDDTGKKAADKFHKAFSGAGIKHQVIDLMLTDKGDLADYCKLHTTAAYNDLLNCPVIGVKVLDAQTEPPQGKLKDLVKELVQARKAGQAENLPNLLENIQNEINITRSELFSSPVTDMLSLTDRYHERLDNAREGKEAGLGFNYGLPKLEGLIGRLVPGRILTILAETGMGKSTLGAVFASNLLSKAPGLAVTTESIPVDWLNKVVAYRTGIPTDVLEEGKITDEQYKRVCGELGTLSAQKCRVLDCQNPTTAQIVSAVQTGIKEHGYQWLLIDSGSNVNVTGAAGLYDRTEAAMDCAQEMARLGLAVIITIQVGRNLDGKKYRIPQIHDGKGSGRIEDNSDVMLALYNHGELVARGEAKPELEFPEGTIMLRCLKHRHKGRVVGQAVHLDWIGGKGVYG